MEALSPRLAVLIVVDGLSERQLLEYRDQYGTGGFGLLLEQGAHFESARYGHSTTFTAAGHATISTGADPSGHGVVANDWVDRNGFLPFYCVQDLDVRPLGEERGRGVSAASLKASTLADSLRSANRDSRAVSIAIKDRAAVLMAGQGGTAYYFSANTGRFVTSTHYLSSYPRWWEAFYAASPQNAWFGAEWGLSREPEAFSRSVTAAREIHTPEGRMGAGFPHPLGRSLEMPARPYYRELARSPFGQQYTLQFVEAALAGEELGRRGATDFLAVGFSTLDYVNHNYGPESIESHDTMLRLDRVIAQLFDLLDRHVGLDNIVVALTADHGFPQSPEYRAERGLGGGRIDMPAVVAELEQDLSRRFSRARDAVRWFAPGLFINGPVFEAAGFDPVEVESAAADFLRRQEGVLAVFTRSHLEQDTPAASPLEEAVRRSWHPVNSGDLIVVQREGWYLSGAPRANASMHGSPHDYDRQVPLVYWGAPFQPGHYPDPVEVRDLAPTLASVLGVPPPPGASGRVLAEGLR